MAIDVQVCHYYSMAQSHLQQNGQDKLSTTQTASPLCGKMQPVSWSFQSINERPSAGSLGWAAAIFLFRLLVNREVRRLGLK